MPGEEIVQSRVAPHLAEPRIDIEKHPTFCVAEEVSVIEEAHDVQHKLCRRHKRFDLPARSSDHLFCLVVKQAIRPGEIKAIHDLPEVEEVVRFVERAGLAIPVDAHVRIQPVKKQDIPSEPLETQKILQKHPGVSAITGSLSKRACDDDVAIHHPAPFCCAALSSIAPQRALKSQVLYAALVSLSRFDRD